MRRAFSACTFILDPDDKILLIRHKLLQKWLPPGGEFENKIDPGLPPGIAPHILFETPLECAKREVKEETGLEPHYVKLTVNDWDAPGFLGYEEHLAGPKGLHMNFVFMAFSSTTEVVGDGSFSESRWFKVNEIGALEDTTDSVRLYAEKTRVFSSNPSVLRRLRALTD